MLAEPPLHNPQLSVQVVESPLMHKRLVLAGTIRLGNLLAYDSRDWVDPVEIGQCMGLSNPCISHCVLQEVRAVLPPASLDFLEWA